jgi:hypothetical protein
MQVRVPFQQRWQQALLEGGKVCTSRTKRLGGPGDTFEAFGADFELRTVERLTLRDIRDNLHLQEGCETADEFQRLWTDLHPRKGFVPDQLVYVHWFVRKDTGQQKHVENGGSGGGLSM